MKPIYIFDMDECPHCSSLQEFHSGNLTQPYILVMGFPRRWVGVDDVQSWEILAKIHRQQDAVSELDPVFFLLSKGPLHSRCVSLSQLLDRKGGGGEASFCSVCEQHQQQRKNASEKLMEAGKDWKRSGGHLADLWSSFPDLWERMMPDQAKVLAIEELKLKNNDHSLA